MPRGNFVTVFVFVGILIISGRLVENLFNCTCILFNFCGQYLRGFSFKLRLHSDIVVGLFNFSSLI
jgi:hypothetical protein